MKVKPLGLGLVFIPNIFGFWVWVWIMFWFSYFSINKAALGLLLKIL